MERKTPVRGFWKAAEGSFCLFKKLPECVPQAVFVSRFGKTDNSLGRLVSGVWERDGGRGMGGYICLPFIRNFFRLSTQWCDES